MRQMNVLSWFFAFRRMVLCGILTGYPLGYESALAQAIAWDQLTKGLAIGIWTPETACREVPPLLVAEIDPLYYRFSIHYYRNESTAVPPDIHEWQTRTGHDLVFNAGLFRENFAYLGLLYAQGKALGGKRHTTWMGLFVANPLTPGKHSAGILDLALDTFDEEHPPYREVAQSLMLLDRMGKVRVRQTGKQSQQTIIAEQEDGHILVLKTTEATSLYAIGQCLRDAFPNVRQAMAMDGGSSSDLSISPSLRREIANTEGGHPWISLVNAGATGHVPLPTVIGISPR